MNHTPTPWTTNRDSKHNGRSIGTTKGAVCLLTDDVYPAEETTANAAFIVLAVNAHDDLATLLSRFYAATYGKTDLIPLLDFEQARAALKRAGIPEKS